MLSNIFAASTEIHENTNEIQPLPFKAERLVHFNVNNSSFLETDFLDLLNTVPISKSNPVGIIDRGGSCYADSVIQMLFRIPVIRKIIANLDYYPANTIAQGLNHMFHQLQTNETENASYNFGLSMQALPDVHAENGPGDADEYLNLILNTLKEITPEPQHRHFSLDFSFTCKNSDRIYFDSGTRISLPLIHDVRFQHVSNLLDEYFAPETLELRDETIVRTRRLQNLPEFIVIHLERVLVDMTGIRKIETAVHMPEELDFAPYTNTHDTAKYRLKMFIVHLGNASRGHFISHYRENSSTWLTFNDRSVTINSERVQNDLKHGVIYFYEQISNSPAMP